MPDGSSPRVWGTHSRLDCLRNRCRFIPTGVGNASSRTSRPLFRSVHPHGCGERKFIFSGISRENGSSPRVWGTRHEAYQVLFPIRFIPTGVGNAYWSATHQKSTAVHPHGCGERPMRLYWHDQQHGSSPRVWGTLVHRPVRPAPVRFIPTGVGNAIDTGAFGHYFPVHPHGCGERWTRWCMPGQSVGSSPRVWGTLVPGTAPFTNRRFIPTGVGNARCAAVARSPLPVHPHGCGERLLA